MVSEDVARVHREAIIVEGHRDMFEMNYLAAKGQQYPVLNVTLPRLKRANISTTFYAISGDSLTHANGTYRFLHAALQNIDALRTEMAASQGQMKLILHREDLPAAPTPDTVHFVLSFEGGKPLEGRLESASHADHLEFAQRTRRWREGGQNRRRLVPFRSSRGE